MSRETDYVQKIIDVILDTFNADENQRAKWNDTFLEQLPEFEKLLKPTLIECDKLFENYDGSDPSSKITDVFKVLIDGMKLGLKGIGAKLGISYYLGIYGLNQEGRDKIKLATDVIRQVFRDYCSGVDVINCGIVKEKAKFYFVVEEWGEDIVRHIFVF